VKRTEIAVENESKRKVTLIKKTAAKEINLAAALLL